jgi:Carboxypeptidase regulatory-like domain
MTFIRTLVASSTAFFLLAGFALAQSTGTVQGIAKDPSGGVVPGAVVTLTNIATHQKTQATTTTAGAYSFPFLPPERTR